MKLLGSPTLFIMAAIILGVAQVGLCRGDCPYAPEYVNGIRLAVVTSVEGQPCPVGPRCEGLASHVGRKCPNKVEDCEGEIIWKKETEAKCDAWLFCEDHDYPVKQCGNYVVVERARCNNTNCRIEAYEAEKRECISHGTIQRCPGNHPV